MLQTLLPTIALVAVAVYVPSLLFGVWLVRESGRARRGDGVDP